MRIRIIDAFTDRSFAGNPAAVCLLETESWPDDAWMGDIAAEMSLPMTAFALPLPGDDSADWGLRWFMANRDEERLCGHATLAAAHALHTDNGGPVNVRFSTLGGVLPARTADDGTVTLDFPAATVTEVSAPDGLSGALGATPGATFATGTLGDLMAAFADEAAVRGLAPDFDALAALIRREGLRGIIATAQAADPDGGYDFVSRFFSPPGIPEDPVTGSAHTALAPYWEQRLGREGLIGLQASARGGLVTTAVHGDRVHLSGRAVTVLDGMLQHSASPS